MAHNLEKDDFIRYARHLALPDFGPAHQKYLKNTKILMVGAGGLGAAALPYLAGAGIGHITVMDHDTLDTTNLHRQTVYQEAQAGLSKADLAVSYLKNLNPSVEVQSVNDRLTAHNADALCRGYTLILDGSDNFETKLLLNRISIQTETPLLSASVNRFEALIGLFAGYLADGPCYHCLFPELPQNARNCNEAGVLGTAAGLAGLYQAHLALLYLADIGDVTVGTLLTADFKTLRINKMALEKFSGCPVCKNATVRKSSKKDLSMPIPLIAYHDLDRDTVLIDVRQPEETAQDPITGAINIPVMELYLRVDEIPREKKLATVCAANIRSRQAAEYLSAMGYEDVSILDRFSF